MMIRALVIAALLMASPSPARSAQSVLLIKHKRITCGTSQGIEGIREGCIDEGKELCCQWLASLTGP